MDKRIKASFKDRLKTAMSIRKKTATDICMATGIAKSTFSQYVSGRNEAKSDRVHTIAKYLDVNEVWLLGYDVPMERTIEQKKNDDLVKVITKLRGDSDFFELVNNITKLNASQLESLKPLIAVFVNQQLED